MEKWKVIADCSHYEVSNRGQVRSLPRLVKCRGAGLRQVVGGIVKQPALKITGYRLATLSLDAGGRRTFLVHLLVLKAFRGTPPVTGMVCRHLDGDVDNNRLANLVWGTCKENMDDQRRHGTLSMGENHPCAKLTDKKVLRIRKLFATGEYTQKALAVWCGIAVASMYAIVHRKTWKHI